MGPRLSHSFLKKTFAPIRHRLKLIVHWCRPADDATANVRGGIDVGRRLPISRSASGSVHGHSLEGYLDTACIVLIACFQPTTFRQEGGGAVHSGRR